MINGILEKWKWSKDRIAMTKDAFNKKSLFYSTMDLETRKRPGEALRVECSVVRMRDVDFEEQRQWMKRWMKRKKRIDRVGNEEHLNRIKENFWI